MSFELVAGAVVADRYRLDRLLGEGGMGVVWAATEIATGKQVALKLLRPGIAESATGRRRFLREARAIAAVRHPNVVTIQDVVGLDDGTPVLVMDLLRGESLRDMLSRDGTIPLAELARILLPAISAIGAAHARGIVHRDLKPDNIFLVDGAPDAERVKVLDFGIAKLTAAEGDAAATGAITHTGALLGTPYYMSPEQILGESDVDHRSDIWSIGVILYECLTAVRPTEADSIGKILKRILTGAITPLGARAPGLPADVAAIVDRMLASDRARRPASLQELAHVLERHGPVSYEPFGPPAPPTSHTGAAALPISRAGRPSFNTLALGSPPIEARRLLATLPAPASSRRPARASNRPPALASNRPPALASNRPPALASNRPPALASNRPPALASNRPPALASNRPPALASNRPPALASNRPPATAAAPPRGIPTPVHTPPGLSTSGPDGPADAAAGPAQARRPALARWTVLVAVALVVAAGAALLWGSGQIAATPAAAPASDDGAAGASCPAP